MMLSSETEVLFEPVITEEQENNRSHKEEELLNCVKGTCGNLTSNETEEFSAFLNAMADDETQQDKEVLEAPTFFRTSSVSSTNSSIGNGSNVSFSVLFEDQLDDDDEDIEVVPLETQTVKAKMDENTSHNNLFQGKKQKKSILRKKDLSKILDDFSEKEVFNTNLTDDEMQSLLHSLHNQCNLSSTTPVGDKFPRTAELLEMAIMTIKLLKEREKEKLQERKQLIEKQAAMLQKLIELLKKISSVNKMKGGSNDSSSGQQFTDYNNQRRYSDHKKCNFLGFRSSKPVFHDRFGRFTAERLFNTSPPSSPTRRNKDSQPVISSQVFEDISKLEFVFKPSRTTLASLDRNLRIRKPVNENKSTTKKKVKQKNSLIRTKRKAELRKHLNTKKRKAPMPVTAQEDKKTAFNRRSQRNVTVSHVNTTENKKTSSKKQQNRKNASLKKDLHVSNKQIENLKVRRSQARKKAIASKSGDNFSKISPQPEALSSLSSEASLKVGSEHSPTKVTTSQSKLKIKKQKSKRVNRKNRKAKSGQSNNYSTRSRNSLHLQDENPNSINKDSVQATSTLSQYSDNSKSSTRDDIKDPSVNARISKSQNKKNFKSDEPHKLFYPVHPYTSPDLPVHFIPIDPKNIPDFFPLYYPTFEERSSTEVFPTFIQLEGMGAYGTRPKYIFTNGIQSSSVPHQKLKAEEVLPKILPGILHSTECPLAPDINPHTLASVDPLTLPVKHNSSNVQHKLSFNKAGVAKTSTSLTYGMEIPKTHSNPTKLVQDRPTPSITINKTPVNVNPRVHRCIECCFETLKLGVLKRHQLTHSKVNSYNSLRTDDVQILESKIKKPFDAGHAIKPSRLNNFTPDEPAPTPKSPPSSQHSDNNGSGIKIVSTESLKDSSSMQDAFRGFSGASGNNLFEKKFPSITIVPLIHLKE